MGEGDGGLDMGWTWAFRAGALGLTASHLMVPEHQARSIPLNKEPWSLANIFEAPSVTRNSFEFCHIA